MATENIQKGIYTIHWSAILAGSFVALACWIFLYAVGAAIGASGGQGEIGTWTVIYTLVAPIIALFFGGLVVARSSGIISRGDGALHGVIVWGFTTVLGSLILGSLGIAAVLNAQGTAGIPAGYFWAVAGSIFCSLLAAILGASTLSRKRTGLPLTT
jgi:hypothetical protein